MERKDVLAESLSTAPPPDRDAALRARLRNGGEKAGFGPFVLFWSKPI
jgi:hypothetical protein